MSRRWVPYTALCALAVASAVPRAGLRSQTTCPDANPFDAVPDQVALQACLDDYDVVLLEPEGQAGYVGYLVADNLKLRRHGVLLTTADSPRKATIRAAPELSDSMLRASGFDNFEISFIRFDGNREHRTVRDKPCSAGNKRNVELTGKGFHVRYVESFGAVCGSAMTVGGSQSFDISGSLFYDNGRQPEDAGGISGLWSDGLTVFDCRNSTVRDNAFWDNTDIDLAVNGGASCSVYRNTISHGRKYAFAGLAIGDPSRSGGEFSDNRVSSEYNLLGFGIIVGCHPWSQCGGGYASDVQVYNNRVTGAVVNLAIDGLNGGSVRYNTVSDAQGDRVLNCPGARADYTVGHAINVAPLQSGYVARIFDVGSNCQ
jgi:Right handed beta helix region